MEEETITITRKVYESLVEDSKMLCALEGAGVDNWSGYSYAMEWLEENDD